jgi:hypothetical protein
MQGGCSLTDNFYPGGHPVGPGEQAVEAGRTRIVIHVHQRERTESHSMAAVCGHSGATSLI